MIWCKLREGNWTLVEIGDAFSLNDPWGLELIHDSKYKADLGIGMFMIIGYVPSETLAH